MKLYCLLKINIQACKLPIKDNRARENGGEEAGTGREEKGERRREKGKSLPPYICHSLPGLLFQFCLILKMVCLTGINQ